MHSLMTSLDLPPSAAERRHADLLRSERTMLWVRTLAAVFGLVQIVTYAALPYPDGWAGAALGLVVVMAVVNMVVLVLLMTRWPSTLPRARGLALTTTTLDVLVANGLVLAYSFDPGSAHWAILFLTPLLGAARFRLPGALVAWGATTVLYIARQSFAAARFDDISFSPSSIGFRMGLALLVALVAGLLARDLARERERTAQALTEVARVDLLRARLVGSLAHDLRSPLTAISGALRAITPGQPPDMQAQLLDLARRQAARLSRVADGMIDLARVERGQLELETHPTVLADVVAATIEALAPKDGEVEVTVPDGLVVDADPDRLDQILYNLIGNAMRHGRPPVEVTAVEDGQTVVLAVTDHGRGVPEERQDGLFDAFTTSGSGGIGLGLWLVQELARAHGGEARYRTTENGGACFEVVLPSVVR